MYDDDRTRVGLVRKVKDGFYKREFYGATKKDHQARLVW